MTLKQGLLEYKNKPSVDKSMVLGLKDTSELMKSENEHLSLMRVFCHAWKVMSFTYSGFRELLKQ